MPTLHPNSTNYVHSYEPNTNDLTMAMDYNSAGQPILRTADPQLHTTSTGRQTVSTQQLVYFNTFQYTKDPDVWDEQTHNGGAVDFDQDLGMCAMTVAGQINSEAVQQSRRVVRYTPGRQNELTFSVIFTQPVAGIRRRIGLFDEHNGFYFEDGGDGSYYCVLRRTANNTTTETRVSRSQWNFDQLDGAGPSGIVADPTKIQMVVFEYNWFGAGRVEVSWIVNNQKLPIHRFDTANTLSTTWCATPFLPIRREITNTLGTPGTHTMYIGSCSVAAEGSVDLLGTESNINSPITGVSTGNTANVFKPILSIRLKSNRLQGVVIPIDFQAATLDNTAIFYRLVQNAQLTGANWTITNDASFVEYDTSATATSSGTVLKTGFLSTSAQGQLQTFDSRVVSQLARNQMGTASDTLTVEVASVQANKAAFASINWIELR
jgi:hypothetical protein